MYKLYFKFKQSYYNPNDLKFEIDYVYGCLPIPTSYL